MADPLFIFAPPRTFTSVICAMVGQHPQMFGLPETNLFVAETMRGWIAQPALAVHASGLLRTVAQLFFGEQSPMAVLGARRWIGQRLDRSVANVYRELADFTDPAILVDKSPSSVEREATLRRIDAAFPNARYLHLLRHPRSFGESISNFAGNAQVGLAWLQHVESYDFSTDPPTIDPQVAWYRIHSSVHQFLRELPPERSMWLRGEDVLDDPARYCRMIVDWLGLRSDPAALDEMMHPERSSFSRFGPPSAPFGNNLHFLEDPRLRPRRSRPESLAGALPWRTDGRGFYPEVEALARDYGYV